METDALAQFYRQRRILVAGGLGFIGSNLVNRLVAGGANVTVVDSLSPGHGGNLHNIKGLETAVRLHIGDVCEDSTLSTVVPQQQVVFNLVGQTSHLDSMTDPQSDVRANCVAQLHFLEACRRYCPSAQIVHVSTRQIYGRPQYLPVDESHPLSPVDINGANKLAGEWYHRIYHAAYGMRTCVLRFTNTYGPRMRVRDARQTFLGVWIRLLLEGKQFQVWGGRQKRDFTYVDDAVQALLLAGASEGAAGKVYNLGGDQVHTLIETADLLIDVNGGGEYQVCPFPPERQRIDIGDYHSTYTAITSALGWRPTTSLEDGLKTTLEYFRPNLHHYLGPET